VRKRIRCSEFSLHLILFGSQDYLLCAVLLVVLRRSAQRRFMASWMRFRPSGLSFRFLPVPEFLLPLGLPGPFVPTLESPESSSRACCSFAI